MIRLGRILFVDFRKNLVIILNKALDRIDNLIRINLFIKCNALTRVGRLKCAIRGDLESIDIESVRATGQGSLYAVNIRFHPGILTLDDTKLFSLIVSNILSANLSDIPLTIIFNCTKQLCGQVRAIITNFNSAARTAMRGGEHKLIGSGRIADLNARLLILINIVHDGSQRRINRILADFHTIDLKRIQLVTIFIQLVAAILVLYSVQAGKSGAGFT